MTSRIHKNKMEKLFNALSILLAFFPIMPYEMRSIVTAIWAFVGVLIIKKGNFGIKKYLIYLSPFAVIFASIIYSDNIYYGFEEIVRMASIPVIGTIFFFNKHHLDQRLIKAIGTAFLISTSLLMIVATVSITSQHSELFSPPTELELKNLGISPTDQILVEKQAGIIKTRRLRNHIQSFTGSSTTYIALFIVYSIYISIEILKKQTSLFFRALICFLILFFVLSLFLIGSRISMISVFCVCTLFILTKTSKAGIYNYLILLVLVGSAFIFNSTAKHRFKEIFKSNMSLINHKSEYNSINTRLGIYLCSGKIISKRFVFGVGIGDTKEKLQGCYDEKLQSEVYKWNYYNTHNQYLHFFLAAGIIGFLSYLLSLSFQLFQAIRAKNQDQLFIVALIIIFSLTENILLRNDGVLFYSIFTSITFFNDEK